MTQELTHIETSQTKFKPDFGFVLGDILTHKEPPEEEQVLEQQKGGLSHASSLTLVPIAVSKDSDIKQRIAAISEEGFHISLITYLVLLLLESIKEQFVSYFFDLNILLGVVLVTGILMALTSSERNETVSSHKPFSWYGRYVALLSIGGALLVFYKTESLGALSLVVSIVTGVIIFLLSYVLMHEENEEFNL